MKKNKLITSENNYVNAFSDRGEIVILERTKEGERVIRREPLVYEYFTPDVHGDFLTIYGDRCRRNFASNANELRSLASTNPDNAYEADVNQVFKYLSANYDFESTPDLKVGIYDIEVEWKESTRYSDSDKTENRIISVAVYQKWSKQMHCLVLVPDNITAEECEIACANVQARYDSNTTVESCITESFLLNRLFDLLEDADVISGWNSEAYDFKYIVNRTKKILGEDGVRRLSPIGGLPRERESFNAKTRSFFKIYEPSGLVHLDYMLLYKKYTYIELTSYSLDNVATVELDDHKVEYTGSLFNLYLENLEQFIEYNIKDVELVDRLDDKLKFIDLSNLLAHNNGVLMQTTLGTVALTEQAIINEGHYYFETPVIFPCKPPKPNKAMDDDDGNESTVDDGAAGAFVVNPQKGVRKQVSGIDVESLYPSIIRMLNMSPETLIGHINSDYTDSVIREKVANGEVKSATEAWHKYFNTLEFDEIIEKTDNLVTFELNRSDKKITAAGKEIYDLIFSNDNWAISANGTVFDRTKIGVIPSLLTRWFMERRKLKALKDEWKDKLDLATTPEEKANCEYWVTFYDQRQMAKKINLNALYGALLNKACRFYDKRIGQSTTLSGRTVTRHMGSMVNKLVTGEYTVHGGAVIYGDSVTGDTMLTTSFGEMTIEEAFTKGINQMWLSADGTRQYTLPKGGMEVLTFNPEENETYMGAINYIYRHKTHKAKWKVTDSDGNSVIVTGDHSVMVEREYGQLVKVKPSDMVIGDKLISVRGDDFGRTTCAKIEQLEDFDDEYVYDVGMTNGNHNWFFGNNMLLKNTDSIYFSVAEYMQSLGFEFELSKEETIELYDSISKEVNATFPSFLHGRFNVGLERGAYISAARENLSDYSLFIKKKRYAMRLYDVDGRRMDVKGKKGKMKYMGIEVKRSDTPKIIQDVLVDGLESLLDGKGEREVMDIFINFKRRIIEMNPWLLGRPCGANAVQFYTNQYNEYMQGNSKKKPRIPAAISGAIYFNQLLDDYNEGKIARIGDGSKVINCKLKKNISGFDCISFPTDMVEFPDWFKALPFDLDTTVKSTFIKKVDNIFGVTGFNIDTLNASVAVFDNFVEDDF